MSVPVERETRRSVSMQNRATGIGSVLTLRAVLLGLILIVANGYWVLNMEFFQWSGHPTSIALFFNAIFVLLIVQAGNALVHRIAPGWALSRSELLLIYSMVCLGTAITSFDTIPVLLTIFTYSFRYATPENGWNTVINPHLPRWITVQDPQVYTGLYEGGNLYRWETLFAWLVPVGVWVGFLLVLLFVMLCINSLFRRQWLEHEHLACPLVRLPLEISQPDARLFRAYSFWLGFGIFAAIDIANVAGVILHGQPVLNFAEFRYARGMGDWGELFRFFNFQPFLVSLGYFLPTDFLFSVWFFYVIWFGLQRVANRTMHLGSLFGMEWNFTGLESFGAAVIFAPVALWRGRRHMAEVWNLIRGRATGLTQEREALSYQVAVAGIVVGLGFLVWFSSQLGMRVGVGLLCFVIYYIISFAVARVRAQFGSPVHDLMWNTPGEILTRLFGTRIFFTTPDLIGMGVYRWFTHMHRTNPMPIQLEAMKMQDQTKGTSRGLATALMLAGLVAAVAGMWTVLHVNYRLGADLQGSPGLYEPWTTVQQYLTGPTKANPSVWLLYALGAGAGLFLSTMRARYVWWPLHPLGFIIAGVWQIMLVWCPLFIAWVIKTTVVRYGGHRTYQKLMPFFFGVILGEFTVASLAGIVSIIWRIPVYVVWGGS